MVVLFVLFSLSHLLNGVHVGTKTGRQSGRSLEEIVVEANDSKNKIAVLEVEGLISSAPWDRAGRNMVSR